MAIVNRSAIKEITEDMSVATEYYDALETQVHELIAKSVKRAKANQRSTVMRRDL